MSKRRQLAFEVVEALRREKLVPAHVSDVVLADTIERILRELRRIKDFQ